MKFAQTALAGLAAATLALVAPQAEAAKVGGGLTLALGDIVDSAEIGIHGGAYFGIPSVERLSVGGDITYYFIDYATILSFEPNVRFAVVQNPGFNVYPLAGLNIVHARVNVLGFSGSDTDVGLLGGIGIEGKAGPLRPYGEAKLALHGNIYTTLNGGLRFKF